MDPQPTPVDLRRAIDAMNAAAEQFVLDMQEAVNKLNAGINAAVRGEDTKCS